MPPMKRNIPLKDYGFPEDLKLPSENFMLRLIEKSIDDQVKARIFPNGIRNGITEDDITWNLEFLDAIPECLRVFLTIVPIATLRLFVTWLQTQIVLFSFASVLNYINKETVEWLRYRPALTLETITREAFETIRAQYDTVMKEIENAYFEKLKEAGLDKNQGAVLAQTALEGLRACGPAMDFVNDFRNALLLIETKLLKDIRNLNRVQSLWDYLKIIQFYLDFKKDQLAAWIGEIERIIEDQLQG